MDMLTILAQTEPAAEQAHGVVPIDAIWNQITSLSWLEAITFISFGVICLMYGWRVFKVLVTICFALLGMLAGAFVSQQISSEGNPLFASLIGMGILGILSVPLMRWAVSILGAMSGGVLTSALWYAVGLSETYIWAGALVGIVAGGMISFIIFRIAVILFTSLWGAGLIVVGILALLFLYPHTSMQVDTLVHRHNWFLPAVLGVPTALGLFLQHRFVKSSKDWSV